MNPARTFLVVFIIVLLGEPAAELITPLMPYITAAVCAVIFVLVVIGFIRERHAK